MRDEPVIVDAVRTPVGRAFKGSLVDWRSDDLAAHVARALLARVPELDPASIDDVILGAANLVGEQAKNLGRIAGTLAGLPDTVGGVTVSRACASSLQAVRMAADAVAAGSGEVFLALGVESTSHTRQAGFVPAEHGNPRFLDPDRDDYAGDMYIAMGVTAENVARKFRVPRERMDEFAVRSHARAVAAQDAGFHEREIVPVPLPSGTSLTKDDSPRRQTSTDVLATLPAAFVPDGSVTAGNSCPLSDGAAAVLVMSRAKAEELGLKPRARVLGSAASGVAPELMGIGPIDACRKLTERLGLTMGDFDRVELNEAFAAQVLAVVDELGIDEDRQLNLAGGAIALGHPFGMTGARLLTTLLNGLEATAGTLGLATMCVGGGQGFAMAVERLN